MGMTPKRSSGSSPSSAAASSYPIARSLGVLVLLALLGLFLLRHLFGGVDIRAGIK
jgi:hypothetical protein